MDEWIELHNAWNVPIDLGDWMLGDDEKLYILPQGTLLAPGEYHVFYRRDTKIILNNEGQDKVRLLSPEGTLLDEVSYEDAGYDVSYSRLNGCLGEWVTTLPPSPGEANHPPGQPPGYNAVWLPLIRRH
ncbi:MAG: hypothetical protein A2Y73_03715 [Chloroflexi bacterium RBG_13_56_8]|nr:MAG: hypothetical protein A2Y73_03715 [Chloroflexi bacterium RBG_13_56_8]